MPDNDGSGEARKVAAKIDTTAIAVGGSAAITEAIRQWIKDLDAEVERINATREAMPPPINRTTKRRAAKQTARALRAPHGILIRRKLRFHAGFRAIQPFAP